MVTEIDSPREEVDVGAPEEETPKRPTFWRSLGNFAVGAAVWGWFGMLYFTGGECEVQNLAIECTDGALLTTINIPVMVIGVIFGLFAIVGGLLGMYQSLFGKDGD